VEYFNDTIFCELRKIYFATTDGRSVPMLILSVLFRVAPLEVANVIVGPFTVYVADLLTNLWLTKKCHGDEAMCGPSNTLVSLSEIHDQVAVNSRTL